MRLLSVLSAAVKGPSRRSCGAMAGRLTALPREYDLDWVGRAVPCAPHFLCNAELQTPPHLAEARMICSRQAGKAARMGHHSTASLRTMIG